MARILCFVPGLMAVCAGCGSDDGGAACDPAACNVRCVAAGQPSGFCSGSLCSCGGAGDGGGDLGPDGDADADADDGTEDVGPSCAEIDIGSALGASLASAGSPTVDHVPGCGTVPDTLVGWVAPSAGLFRFHIACLSGPGGGALGILDGWTCDAPLLACPTWECYCTEWREECCCWMPCTVERYLEQRLDAGQHVLLALEHGCTLGIYYLSGSEAGACFDGIDNDSDGDVDCRDEDCALTEPGCVEGGDQCFNDLDDDHDGMVDEYDPDCRDEIVESGAECSNGLDDDRDGESDCHDYDCQMGPMICELNCGDRIDDDGDGLTDCADAYDCSRPGIDEGVGDPYPICCMNGRDDDCDGLTDCADPDCATMIAAECDFEPSPGCCTNGRDDDCDGLTDCADSDCVGVGGC